MVFGFVTTGFSVSAVVAPPLYGWMMDQGEPRLIYLCAAGFTALSLLMARSAKPAETARHRFRVSAQAALRAPRSKSPARHQRQPDTLDLGRSTA